MFGRILGAVILLALAAAALVLGWPQLFGLEQADGIAQAVALRGAAALAAIVLAALVLLLMILARPLRRFLAGVVLVLVALVALEAVVLGSRGLVAGPLPAPAADAVTVLSWNTKGGAMPATEVADLVEQTGADVVTLPETTEQYAATVRDLLDADGGQWQLFVAAYDRISPARSTSLLVSRRLGGYTADTSRPTTGQLPSIVAVPADGRGPTIVAVHAVAPTDHGTWRSDLDWLADACAAGEDIIMAGDFNSTVDHWSHLVDAAVPGARLGACLDSAEADGQGGQGTWPTDVPALLGAPIDHVLHSAGWTATGFRVIGSRDDSGSDHRPVLAQLVPTG